MHSIPSAGTESADGVLQLRKRFTATVMAMLDNVRGIASALRQSINQPDQEISMNALKIVGIVLVLAGLGGLFTGGFSFTKDTTAAKIGPIELTVKEKESVNIPQWLSLGALALGAIVLVAGFRKS